jgi:prophage regulatory protein
MARQQGQSGRPKEAAELLSIGVSTLWRWVREQPNFPRPRRLSPRCTVFDLDELIAWRDAQACTDGRARTERTAP